VSIFPSEKQAEVMFSLQDQNRALRGELGRKIGKQIRIVPELAFYLDTSIDYAEHIDELLKK
jgi:ribosome-binding factor A